MTSSTGTGETKKKEPKEKKPGIATTIAAVTAMLTAGGTLVKDIQGQHEQELIQKSVFNYATAQTAEIRERLAKLEAHIEWLKKASEAPAMMVEAPECSSDADCGEGKICKEGKCEARATMGMGGGSTGVGGGVGVLVESPPPPRPSPRDLKRRPPEKFEDIKDYVQMEQKAWPAE